MNVTPTRVWITRAEPGAARTAARLRDMGFEPIVTPLLAIKHLAPPVPDLASFAALAFTSINGVAAFALLTPRRDLPVFAVGDATAQAAHDAGFRNVRSASGDLHALARLIASAISNAAVLVPQAEAPAGDFTAALTAAGARNVSIQSLTVYRAIEMPAAAPALFDAVLIHSPRAGQALAKRGNDALAHAVLACISPAAAAPLVALGLTPVIATSPDEASLLTILNAALGKRDPAV
ncbi:uroporphyrinogen-III synthase [Brevundimonas vesicularis]|uniref:Uroporphyrinogen-III synthase n=1 Tax=Brevundimonas vesicularis TaxID=41276 RepID=A0A7W9L689_BREVE|nr:uroporphyrinogen-III synthase [Brevundimonas vesicularis]MBB5772153.1 uroporphyrinogen-III synthase [Brevundimonas vesicularis]